MLTSAAVPIMVRILSPHIGETMARSAVEAHCQKLGIAAGGSVSPEQLQALLQRLEGGLNIFLGKEKASRVIADISAALASEALP